MIDFITQGKYRKLTSSALKIIALISMFIDHIGAGVMLYTIREGIYPFGLDFDSASKIYYFLRDVGRTAFPLYCFLLVEGFYHTRNRFKYAFNMGLFGLVSEAVYDATFKVREDVANPDIVQLLLENKDRVLKASNVFFTLFIGLVVICALNYIEEKFKTDEPVLFPVFNVMRNPLYMVLYLVPIVAGCGVAYYFNTDYDYLGVLVIVAFYIFRNNPLFACIAAYLILLNLESEVWAWPAFLFILMYNGKPGTVSKRFKYVFYAFYPAHLTLLYLIRCYIL